MYVDYGLPAAYSINIFVNYYHYYFIDTSSHLVLLACARVCNSV